MRPTFHLAAEPDWLAQDATAPYTHPSLEIEGFIHCTDGAEELVTVADRYYRDDPRPFVVLTIDLDATGSPWQIDAPGKPYPHVYGPVDRRSIVDVRPMPRNDDGSFRAAAEVSRPPGVRWRRSRTTAGSAHAPRAGRRRGRPTSRRGAP